MTALKETIKNNRLVRHLYYYGRGIVKNKLLSAKAQKTLDAFGVTFSNPTEKVLLVKDMVRMNAMYGFDFDEYLLYHFRDKTMQERLAFVADWEHLGYTCAMNNYASAEIFDNKWKTYNTYKEFYHRDVILCGSEADKAKFEEFAQKHTRFIAKPLDMSCGKGVQIFDQEEQGISSNALFMMLLDTYKKNFIVEELIVQAPEIAKLHPSSVNTVRVPVVRTDSETFIVHPFLRIGQHGNHVDNAGAGGIMGAVDAETGKVFAAADKHGKVFLSHPDTGEKIVDYVIPRWDEAKELVKKLAEIIPDNRYTGWDLALTENGWVVVEANRRGQFVFQIPMQKGFRKEVNTLLKKMGKKY